jgi:hypothetical protein
MNTAIPRGHTAVMAQRAEAPDSLDYFPTPPWATRALVEIVLGYAEVKALCAWEPAAGEGHMVEVLREYFGEVHASDVHDYGRGYTVGSFVGEGASVAFWPTAGSSRPDWIITNPPFNLGEEFAERGLAASRQGVALLLRSAWMEGGKRYRNIFSRKPPTTIAVFSERVPMAKGKWDPDGSTATSYAWFVWRHAQVGIGTQFMWIPPGQRKALERPDDRRRFAAAPEPMALFTGGATP